jgi:hypothetical protein
LSGVGCVARRGQGRVLRPKCYTPILTAHRRIYIPYRTEITVRIILKINDFNLVNGDVPYLYIYVSNIEYEYRRASRPARCADGTGRAGESATGRGTRGVAEVTRRKTDPNRRRQPERTSRRAKVSRHSTRISLRPTSPACASVAHAPSRGAESVERGGAASTPASGDPDRAARSPQRRREGTRRMCALRMRATGMGAATGYTIQR